MVRLVSCGHDVCLKPCNKCTTIQLRLRFPVYSQRFRQRLTHASSQLRQPSESDIRFINHTNIMRFFAANRWFRGNFASYDDRSRQKWKKALVSCDSCRNVLRERRRPKSRRSSEDGRCDRHQIAAGAFVACSKVLMVLFERRKEKCDHLMWYNSSSDSMQKNCRCTHYAIHSDLSCLLTLLYSLRNNVTLAHITRCQVCV